MADALGSIRATLSDSGAPIAAASYDAWGVPQSSAIAPFGFTGELQRGSDVWLRARWYGAGRGGFGGRDPFAGNAQTPYSMQYYQYGYSNPVSNRDPSGQMVPSPPPAVPPGPRPFPGDSWPCFLDQVYVPSLGGCIVPAPSDHPEPPQGPIYECAKFLDHAANSLWDLGLVIGVSTSVTGLTFQGVANIEQVFDLYTFEYGVFYAGGGGNSFFELVGAGVHGYYGFQWGWSNFLKAPTINNYSGLSKSYSGGVEIGKIGVSITYSSSATEGAEQPYTTPPNMLLQSVSIGGDYGAALALPISASVITTRATLLPGTGTGNRFRTGARGRPTAADAKRFETFLQEAIRDPILEVYALQVVQHNALFWDSMQ